MLADRDLDALLDGAAGVRDADLPALPEELLAAVTADAGLSLVVPEPEPASVVAARQLVADAHEARTAPRRRTRRRTVVRVATAVVALAAAWAAAVVLGAPPEPGAPAVPSASGPVVPGALALVAAEAVTFPVTVEAPPEGLAPFYSRYGGMPQYGDAPPWYVAAYLPVDPQSGAIGPPGSGQVVLGLYPEDPRSSDEYGFSAEGEPTGTATVDGTEAAVWRQDGVVGLLWERTDGRWVSLTGEGTRVDVAALVAVGESVVDRPQPVGLQFGLAPAGWSVGGYEESRSLDLVSDADPLLALRLSTVGAQYTGTIDELLEGMPTAASTETVPVQGRDGRLALFAGDEGQPPFWTLVGRLADGRFFRLLAPSALTRDQVLQIGEQVTAAS
ncbi:hypothetical protein [Geodermatophilus nigrescens]|uniref:Uncharacterized protein n=1 Tax=Geodermatophilus nigrescens TaxID=1070870 RepID=A0A1M5Q2Q0_9ACTN|nr:hypothetical protein [Geodermatophilus nigrescens]SHH08354.1 hypothetical protein SAMN05444351_3971 [Geodermatophilus nigrescens]